MYQYYKNQRKYMKFDIYCDENYPDLFTSAKPKVEYLTIGSLWLRRDLRVDIKNKITALREKHNIWGEIKWRKVSNSSLEFYKDLIDLFESYKHNVRFRCILVDRKQFRKELCQNDEELGFYKFYYQLLNHWIDSFNEYNVFCDIKTNYDLHRLKVLKNCLINANLMAKIQNVQALPSKEVVLIQICDFLLGMTSAYTNKTLIENSAKAKLVQYYQQKYKRTFTPTYKNEFKFNIFKINLKGGW